MDTSTIDQAYQQLQTESQDVAIGAGIGLGEDLINNIL